MPLGALGSRVRRQSGCAEGPGYCSEVTLKRPLAGRLARPGKLTADSEWRFSSQASKAAKLFPVAQGQLRSVLVLFSSPSKTRKFSLFEKLCVTVSILA